MPVKIVIRLLAIVFLDADIHKLTIRTGMVMSRIWALRDVSGSLETAAVWPTWDVY